MYDNDIPQYDVDDKWYVDGVLTITDYGLAVYTTAPPHGKKRGLYSITFNQEVKVKLGLTHLSSSIPAGAIADKDMAGFLYQSMTH